LPTSTDAEIAFTDLEAIPVWARSSVAAAVRAGLVDGYPDLTFRASDKISRLEMTAIAVRSLGLELSTTSAQPDFVDYDQIPDWGQPYTAVAVESGLIQGRSGNRFEPNDYTSRAEAVTILLNLLRLQLK
jgi:hypothetical protein